MAFPGPYCRRLGLKSNLVCGTAKVRFPALQNGAVLELMEHARRQGLSMEEFSGFLVRACSKQSSLSSTRSAVCQVRIRKTKLRGLQREEHLDKYFCFPASKTAIGNTSPVDGNGCDPTSLDSLSDSEHEVPEVSDPKHQVPEFSNPKHQVPELSNPKHDELNGLESLGIPRDRGRYCPETLDVSGDEEHHCPQVDFLQIPVNTLRRYKRHFKISNRPGLNKSQLAEVVTKHFRTLPVNEKETTTYFFYMAKNYSSRLDHKAPEVGTS